MKRGEFLRRLGGALLAGKVASELALPEVAKAQKPACPVCEDNGHVYYEMEPVGVAFRAEGSYLPDHDGWRVYSGPCPKCDENEYVKAMVHFRRQFGVQIVRVHL